VLLTAGLL
jgi:hypothetical protein